MRGSAVVDLIIFLLVSPLAHSFKGSEISKFSEKSVSNQISQSARESSYVLISTEDGTISLVDTTSKEIEWKFHTNEPIYSSYKAPHYHYNDDEALGDDFYMDLDKDFNLYNSSMRNGKRINEIVDASELIGRLPFSLTDRIVLGKKDTSVFLLDGKTGKLVKRYRVDDLYFNTVIQNDKENEITLSKEAPPILIGSGLKESEGLPELVYIERKDFKFQCISKFGDVLWSVSFSEMEAKLQHHESVQLMGGLSSSAGIPIRTSQGKKIYQLSYTRSAPVYRLRYSNFEKLFPRLGFQDGPMYLPFKDRQPNQLAPGERNPLALPSTNEAGQVLSLPLPEAVIPQIIDIVDGSTNQNGFASKFSSLIFLIFGICVSILSVCGLAFLRLRQSKWIKEPCVSEVPILIPKKKKSKKNGTTKAVHKKENGYISGGNKDISFEENEKKLLAAFPSLNNNPMEGYMVGKLFVSNKEIAKGSNGTVVLEGSYEGRPVAVKRLVQTHHDVAQKEILNLMASDKHSNIVRWYGVDQDEHFIYISLERCVCSLNDLIHASSRLLESPMASNSIQTVQINPILDHGKGVELWKENGHPSPILLKLMRDIVSGLVHLHDIGIIHRDLKPQNVLIVKNSSLCAKLSDMGISKRLPADTSALTRNSTGSGSSGWQAPEQIRNERQTRAVDLFSLGCVLFFCMTGGKHPYGDNFERDINILNDRKDLFLVESIPEAVHLLSGLLHPNPNLRPTAQEVLHHPLFWNSDMRLSFLRDASDRVELENREEGSQLLAALESTASVTLNGRWDEKLDNIFLDNIGRYRRYKFDSIRDLLRVIRNKLNHYRELPKETQQLLGSVPEGFDRYFSSRFPKLLIQVYTVLCKYCNNEEFFFKYSKTTVF